MKTQKISLLLAVLTIGSILSPLAHAEDILWKLDFKDLSTGKPLAEVPYAMPSLGPQKVVTDADNTLIGAESLDSLSPVLVFTKKTNAHYMPSFTLKANGAIATGIVTVKFDIAFDKLTISGPVETLMSFPFMDSKGVPNIILVIAARSSSELVLTGAGVAKGPVPFTFKVGEVAHVKAVLDLDKHTFQTFLNETPIAEPDHNDEKFTSFLGLTVRDGTALGGNNGGTFTAGIANLVVSH